MPSAWIQHIKDFAKEKNLSYGCALSDPECSRTYRLKHPPKTKKTKTAPTPPPPPPPPLVAAEPTGNPKMQIKGIDIKRPASDFDFKEIEPVKKKRIAKTAPEKKIELIIEEDEPVNELDNLKSRKDLLGFYKIIEDMVNYKKDFTAIKVIDIFDKTIKSDKKPWFISWRNRKSGKETSIMPYINTKDGEKDLKQINDTINALIAPDFKINVYVGSGAIRAKIIWTGKKGEKNQQKIYEEVVDSKLKPIAFNLQDDGHIPNDEAAYDEFDKRYEKLTDEPVATPKKSEPSKKDILTTLIQMVADDSPDLPAEIKKIRDLFKTHYEGIYKFNYVNDKKYQKLVEEADKAIFTDYGIKTPTVVTEQKGDYKVYYFISKLIFFGYKDSLKLLNIKFEMMKKESLTYNDLPHFPYLLGLIKRVLDKMKNVKLGKMTVDQYLKTKFNFDMVDRLTTGMEPFPPNL
jgi:hypothetical protein